MLELTGGLILEHHGTSELVYRNGDSLKKKEGYQMEGTHLTNSPHWVGLGELC